MPWDALQAITRGMEEDILMDIKDKGGIRLSIQHQKVDRTDSGAGGARMTVERKREEGPHEGRREA